MLTFQEVDQTVFHWINHDLTNPIFDAVFPAITDLHKTWQFKFIFVPTLLLFFMYRFRLKGFFISLGLMISIALADIIGGVAKHYWERPRPFQIGIDAIQRSGAGGFSFPSNHSSNMFCMAFFLSAFFPRYRILFFTVAILIAFSRVYNGVHFPFDVLGGGALGGAVGILVSTLILKLNQATDEYFQKRKGNENG